MRLNRFFTERKNIAVGSSVKLQEEDTEHIRKVLRLKAEDKVILFNGEKEYAATLKLVTKEFVTAEVTEILRSIDSSDKMSLILFQGLLKGGMFDWIVEKAVEIGITQIIPVECEYSQMKSDVADKKIDRWNKIARSAAKQSERMDIPEVTTTIRLKDLNAELLDGLEEIFLFTLNKDGLEGLKLPDSIKAKKIAFIVGPEGGFSPSEHDYLTNTLKLKPYTLGSTILRAETASIVAAGILKFLADRD